MCASNEAGLHALPVAVQYLYRQSGKGGKKRFCKWVRLYTGELGVPFLQMT